MNARQANQVSIRNYLSSIGISPVSSNKRSSLYLAPYRADKQPSLKVSHQENLWVDYGNDNKGGTLIDLVLKLHPQLQCFRCNLRPLKNPPNLFFLFTSKKLLIWIQTANNKYKLLAKSQPLMTNQQTGAIIPKDNS
jgi:hypothetical protein